MIVFKSHLQTPLLMVNFEVKFDEICKLASFHLKCCLNESSLLSSKKAGVSHVNLLNRHNGSSESFEFVLA